MPDGEHPLIMETIALKNAISINISRLVAKAHRTSIEGFTRKLRPALGLFNIYIRIVFKQSKGCTFFFVLINDSRSKQDCWLKHRLTLEKEVLELDKNYKYDPSQYDITFNKNMRLKHLHFLQEFGIRLLRKNLFLNNKTCIWAELKNKLCTNYSQ